MVQFTVTNIFNALKPSTKPAQPVPASVWQRPLYFVAFGLGSGAIRFAPGTFGTLMAALLYMLLPPMPLFAYLALVLLLIIASSLICEKVSKEISIHDHPGMNIDEFAGFFVTMINAPRGFTWILFGFILFRFFDIWKPWPIRYVDENIHGGFGMVFDDVLAGIYAMAIIQLVGYLV